MWTMVYGGEERALFKHRDLPNWGVRADVAVSFSNQKTSTFSFRTIERFDPEEVQFEAEEKAVIWRDRTYSEGDGFGGGTIYFQGWFDDPAMITEGDKEWLEYRINDVWWQLSRHVLSQVRNQITAREGGVPTGAAVLTPIYTPEVFLGEAIDVDGLLYQQTNGEQIVEILQWFNECFNPTKRGATSGRDDTQDVVQAGTIDPQLPIPKKRVNSIFCAEAINDVLRLSPDAVVYVDHTTTIPTLHVRTLGKWNYGTLPATFIDYANLPEVTADITPNQARRISLSKRKTDQIGSVILYYTRTAEVDGASAQQYTTERYPEEVTDFEPLAMRQFVELAGAKISHVRADITAPPIADANSAVVATRRAWWIAHDKSLQDSKVDAASVTVANVKILDEAGAAVNLTTYPNELTSPSLPGWTGAVVKKATVYGEIAFKRYRDDAHLILDQEYTGRPVSHSVTLTNAVTGPYSAVSSADPGEAPPLGLAKLIYYAGNALQYAGQIEFQADQLRSDIYVGCRLKCIGPNHTFQNLLVQSVRQMPHTRRTIVTYGPANPLTLSLWLEIIRAVRQRLIYNMPSGRGDGSGAGGTSTTDYTADGSQNNTSHGSGGATHIGTLFKRTMTSSTGGSSGTSGTAS